MIFIKEEYKWGVSHDVIEEYESYIEKGLIRPYNPIDRYHSEDDPNPVWETIELTEGELLERIAKARKIEKEQAREYEKLLKAKAEGRVHFGPPPYAKHIGDFIFG